MSWNLLCFSNAMALRTGICYNKITLILVLLIECSEEIIEYYYIMYKLISNVDYNYRKWPI